MIIYSCDNFVDAYPTGYRGIFISYSVWPYTTWTPFVLANTAYHTGGVSDVTGGNCDLHVPVITPAIDGFFAAFANFSSIKPFWIHYVAGTTNNWVPQTLPVTSGIGGGSQVRFATVASIDERTSTSGTEALHLAFEEDFPGGNSAIIYKRILHTLGTTHFIYESVAEASQGYGYCTHRHPMIAVGPAPDGNTHGLAQLTWEVTESDNIRPSGGPGPVIATFTPTTWGTKVLERHEVGHFAFSVWSPFTSMYTLQNNLPLPILREETLVQPGMSTTYNTTKEIVYQDTLSKSMVISRFQAPALVAADWKTNRLQEYAQSGSVSLPYYKDPLPDLGSITYRGIYADEHGNFSAKITANPNSFPNKPIEQPVTNNLVHFITLTYPNASCAPKIVVVGVGIPFINWHGVTDSVVGLPWLNYSLGAFAAFPVDDSTSVLVSASQRIPFTEDSIRTANFPTTGLQSLEMKRLLIVDSSLINGILPSPNLRIICKYLLKDSASHLAVQTLDSVLIRGNFGQVVSNVGVDPNDTTTTGLGHTIRTPLAACPSGVGYITMVIQVDSGVLADLIQNQRYGDDIELPIPSDSISFKAIHPSASGAQEGSLHLRISPNPFSKSALITADVSAGIQTDISIFDVLGNPVASPFSDLAPSSGHLECQFDGTKLAAGSYFVRVTNGSQTKTIRMDLQK